MRRLLPLIALLAFALPAASAAARVTNGESALEDEFPWTVALVFAGEDAESGQFCGGSLIAPDQVITAGHCAAGLAPQEVTVVAGENTLPGAESDPNDTDVYRTVDELYLMPTVEGVDPDDFGGPRDDVAVLILSDAVPGATPIAPVDVPGDDARWDVGDELEVAGWGLDENDEFPSDLRKGTVTRRAETGPNGCANAQFIGPFFSDVDMLCALGGDDTTVIDTCIGDSGGPLMTTEGPGTTKLVGLTSFGSPFCDQPDVPGVYTKLANTGIHAFVDDPTSVPAQVHANETGEAPELSGDAVVGETVTCTAPADPGASFTGDPDDFDLRLRRFTDSVGFETVLRDDTDPVPDSLSYTLEDTDEGAFVGCELYARKTGAGGYGLVFGSYAEVTAPPDDTPGTPTTPTPPPVTPTTPTPPPPVLPEPPVIIVPPRDEIAPVTTLIRRRCVRRRCTFTIHATDTGPGAEIRTVRATLRSTFGCRRNGRRRLCTRRATLRAAKVSDGVYRLRTKRLRARARHRLTVRAIDLAGNVETRARLFSFRLSRGGR